MHRQGLHIQIDSLLKSLEGELGHFLNHGFINSSYLDVYTMSYRITLAKQFMRHHDMIVDLIRDYLIKRFRSLPTVIIDTSIPSQTEKSKQMPFGTEEDVDSFFVSLGDMQRDASVYLATLADMCSYFVRNITKHMDDHRS